MKRRAESPPPIDGGDRHQEADDQVMSEVHLGCPPGYCGPHISRFTISIPPGVEPIKIRYNDFFGVQSESTNKMISLDEDGDLVLTRRNDQPDPNVVLTIQHNITSTIPSVGLQVWRAELILADFLLHKMLTTSELDGIVSLELGAGTGLVGILLAHVAKTVFLTDRGNEILDNCATNVQLNSGSFKYQATVYVRELNWEESWSPSSRADDSSTEKRYSWTSSEIEEAQGASLLIAADVIYSDDLTDALFNTLKALMSQGSEKVLYLALEKRNNFSLDDLNIVANGYSHFQSYLKDVEDESFVDGTLPCFVGKRIDLTQIPQYVREYERGNDVELWLIKYQNNKQLLRDFC